MKKALVATLVEPDPDLWFYKLIVERRNKGCFPSWHLKTSLNISIGRIFKIVGRIRTINSIIGSIEKTIKSELNNTQSCKSCITLSVKIINTFRKATKQNRERHIGSKEVVSS